MYNEEVEKKIVIKDTVDHAYDDEQARSMIHSNDGLDMILEKKNTMNE